MCAITGIFAADPTATVSTALLGRMNDVQAHRGPDQHGVHQEPGVGLGIAGCPSSTCPVGSQPLFNEDQSVVVVYNGEIYNFQTLADGAEGWGHRFRTHSDTEVIVHAWEEWGSACVERFRGMFAFALWDRNRRTLFLGARPTRHQAAALCLARRRQPDLRLGIEGAAAASGAGSGHRAAAVEDYFAFGYVPEPRTILKGVRKLPAGHHLTIRRDGRGGAPAAHRRGAPRRLSLRRCRFQRGGGHDGRRHGRLRAGQYLFHLLW
jgi:asparagine synthase (glutamine-hydrolysing)